MGFSDELLSGDPLIDDDMYEGHDETDKENGVITTFVILHKKRLRYDRTLFLQQRWS